MSSASNGTGGRSETGRNPERIQQEIRQTRQKLSATLDEIQGRFAPRQLMNQATDMFKHPDNGGAPRMSNALRDNALPIALIGIGAGWLLYSSMSRGDGGSRRMQGMRDWAGQTSSRTRHRLHDVGEDLSHRASEVKHRAEETYDSLKRGVRRLGRRGRQREESRYGDATSGRWSEERGYGTTGAPWSGAEPYPESSSAYRGEMAGYGAADYAGTEPQVGVYRSGRSGTSTYGQARDRVREASSNLMDTIEDHPLAAGLISLGIGAVVGAALPTSRYESEWIGEYGEDIMERTRAVGNEAMHRAADVARAAADAGIEAAEEETRRQTSQDSSSTPATSGSGSGSGV